MREPRTIISKNLGLDGIVRDIPITITTERQLTKDQYEAQLKELRATCQIQTYQGHEFFVKQEKTDTGTKISTQLLYKKGKE